MSALLGLDKSYPNTNFTPELLKEAFEVYRQGLPPSAVSIETLTLTRDGLRRPIPSTDLDQFLAERRPNEQYQWSRSDHVRDLGDYRLGIIWTENSGHISASSESEAHLRAITSIFEQAERIPQRPLIPDERSSLTIFIGHGGNPLWRELKDHLRDHHQFRVEHYERIATSGLPVVSRINVMVQNSTIALLVLTGEDVAGNEREVIRARQNVIHELGLCQGRFGLSRAIPLVERGVELPSNLTGIDHIPFTRGNIRETFGDVLAAIRREFPLI